VLAILGFCFPFGIVGLILGIIALVQLSQPNAQKQGKGLAIAALIVAAGTMALGSIASIGVLLPALGKARQSARQLKSATQVRAIDTALMMYAMDNKGWYPEPGANWQSRLPLDPVLFVSPRAESAAATDSYIYVPGYKETDFKNPARTVLVYENPKYVPRGPIAVGFADGHIDLVRVDELKGLLDASDKPRENE